VLGILNPDYFAGGALALDPQKAMHAIEKNIAKPLRMPVSEAALGIHRVANVQMAEGIRLVSIKRGIDPRGFALVAFGGAGPVHATALADELGIKIILIPRNPGVLSASGLLAAKVEHEAATTFICDLDKLDSPSLKGAFDILEMRCADLMRSEEVIAESVETQYLADVCYVGQAHYVEVPVSLGSSDAGTGIYREFCSVYEQLYGHHMQTPARVVNIRVVQQALGCKAVVAPSVPTSHSEAMQKGVRHLLTAQTGEYVKAPVFDRDTLPAGWVVHGPAILEQADTTTLLDQGWQARVGEQGILVASKGAQ
jgi:N-methylhydantoinase A/oxoprolinase/acetone carboxylase beta subunit